MKTFRGDGGTGFPGTPAPMAQDRGTGWTTNLTPASIKSLAATPLFHTVARSTRSTSSLASTGSPGILSQDASHQLEIFAPFPSVVNDNLRRLPSYDANHLSGNLDVQNGYAWIIMNDVNFKSQRKLLLWNYQQGGSSSSTRTRPGASSEVFQFSMPGAATDLAPSANLVAIVANGDFKSPAGVMAISSYGQLRFWPRISESHRCTDAVISLSTDESCSVLCSVQGSGFYVLGTSTGRLILISLQGSHSVLQREIRAPSSVLRAVGSWFGLGGSKTSKTNEIDDEMVGLRITSHSGFALLWLLKTSALNVWLIGSNSTDSIIFNDNIITAFQSHLYEEQDKQLGGRVFLDMEICDFQIHSPISGDLNKYPSLLTLLIGSRPSEDQDSTVTEEALLKRGEFTEFYLANYSLNMTSTRSSSSSSSSSSHVSSIRPQLISTSLLPDALGYTDEYPSLIVPSEDSVAYVHWKQFATCAPIPDSGDFLGDILDVTRNTSHRIFGSSSTSNAALYFTPSNGIVKLQLLDTNATVNSIGNKPRNSVVTETNKKSGFMAQASAMDILSEAFHRYMSQSSSQHLSSPSLNYPWTSLVETLWKLDFEAATRLFSTQIADSKPLEDPRWPELAGKGSSSSVFGGGSELHQKSIKNSNEQSGRLQALLYRQIEEKLEVHMNFIRFLVEVGLWDALSLASKDCLEQTSEKLASASLLRAKHNELLQSHQSLLQQHHHNNHPSSTPYSIFQHAIEACLIARGVTRNQWERAGLGAQDVFYAEVSKVESILEPSLSLLKAQLASKMTVESQFALIVQNNDLFQSVFTAAIVHRTQYAKEFYRNIITSDSLDHEEQEDQEEQEEFFRAKVAAFDASIGSPWTRSCHYALKETVRISRQFLEQVQHSKATTASRQLGKGFSSSSAFDLDLDLLNDQLFHLTDALLSDWYQEIVRCQEQDPQNVNELKDSYISLRKELISPFKSDPSQYEKALLLAEKYREFLVIVEICLLQDDEKRLWRYAEQFMHEGFERVVFEYFFVNKQYFKLMTPPRAHWDSLRRYLDETPNAQKLAWQHMIRTNDFESAEFILDNMSLNAPSALESSFNQTTLLSLAKLCQLASGSTPSQLNEEREERLYLRNAQVAIRAMFDHTDEDAPPATSQELVSRLLECSNGNESVQSGYSLQLAIDLYRNTTSLRSESDNYELLETIWHRILTLEHWSDLASALQRGEIDDQTLQENVEGSLFFNVAVHTENIKEELPFDLFLHIVQTVYSTDRAALRVLANAFDLVYRTKGEVTPDLSEIVGPTIEPEILVLEGESSEEEGEENGQDQHQYHQNHVQNVLVEDDVVVAISESTDPSSEVESPEDCPVYMDQSDIEPNHGQDEDVIEMIVSEEE